MPSLKEVWNSPAAEALQTHAKALRWDHPLRGFLSDIRITVLLGPSSSDITALERTLANYRALGDIPELSDAERALLSEIVTTYEGECRNAPRRDTNAFIDSILANRPKDVESRAIKEPQSHSSYYDELIARGDGVQYISGVFVPGIKPWEVEKETYGHLDPARELRAVWLGEEGLALRTFASALPDEHPLRRCMTELHKELTRGLRERPGNRATDTPEHQYAQEVLKSQELPHDLAVTLERIDRLFVERQQHLNDIRWK